MNIIYRVENVKKIKEEIKKAIDEFCNVFNPTEGVLYIFEDTLTKAIFSECHVSADKLIFKGTVDSPLDAENQAEYRANRDVVADNIAFLQMKEDALRKRSFSNIVAEYNVAFDEQHPLKIIGGQHRFIASEEALSKGINQVHGLKGIKRYKAQTNSKRPLSQIMLDCLLKLDLLCAVLEN